MPAATLEIFCCRIIDIDTSLLTPYEHLLDTAEQRRLPGFQSGSARTAFLTSRALLRTTLATRLQCEPAALQFIRDANDKPQLAEPYANWHFNLSHSHDWVVLAVSSIGPVGIDVESHERKNNLSGIARRFFSADENISLTNLDNAQWMEQFFAIWTLKEAHAKALGCGLSKILSCSSFIVARADAHNSVRNIELQLSNAAAGILLAKSWLYRLDENTSLAISQLGTTPNKIALHYSVPLAAKAFLETYFELAPIATGSWSPRVALDTLDNSPRS
jgi:4'-phosphopantetheinyl transferase